MIAIRQVNPSDAGTWAKLRHLLWPESTDAEHAGEIAHFFSGELDEPLAVLVAEDGAHGIVGFVELSIRHRVPGCTSSRVGYVEGLYVVPLLRQTGIAASLIQASRTWAVERRCREFASDRAERVIVDRRFRRRDSVGD